MGPDDRHGARSYFATGVTDPEVVEVQGTKPALLVINRGERFKGCCAVAGWLDDDWVDDSPRASQATRTGQ